jgi:putative peptide zinc metalloprotease protein
VPIAAASQSVRPTDSSVLQFRDDLVIRESAGTFVVEDPDSGESFRFGTEEIFLCRAMDGRQDDAGVIEGFRKTFGLEISPDHLRLFQEHLLAVGLARRSAPLADAPAAPQGSTPTAGSGGSVTPAWKLFNPEKIFVALARVTRPLNPLVWLSLRALWIGVPAAFFVLFRYSADINVDLRAVAGQLGYLGGLLFGLITANLLRCVVVGIVLARYGIPPRAFGIKLRRGVLPRFYVEKSRIRGMGRNEKLWIYGTAILVRLYIIVIGISVWSLFKDTTSVLPSVAVMMVQAGIIGLIMQLLPIETTDGYRWFVTYFNLPPNMLFIGAKVFALRIQGRPLPSSLSNGAGLRYFLYGFLLVTVLVLGSVHIIGRISEGLFQTAPDLLGRATPYIIVVVVGFLVLRWAAARIMHKPKRKAQDTDDEDWEDAEFLEEMARGGGPSGLAAFWKRHRAWAIAGVVVIVLCLPFAYRPGGEIQVLPPVQQMIQAPVSGKIAEVFHEGGDGRLIRQGEVVARMTSGDIENALLTLEQTRSQQTATIDKLKSELAKLQTGARIEELAAAEAKLQQAVEHVSAAQKEWESAKVSATYSAMVLPRLEKLYRSGSLALLQVEEARKTAEIDRINVEKAAKNVASLNKVQEEAQAQLNLLRSGARAEDIDAARHSVEAAQAELARIDQQIAYTKQQQTNAALLMPFEGYLVDSHLDFKRGAYLQQGEMFATAQNNSQPLVEVQLPEYDMEGVEVGATAQVRLFAYPNASLTGKVLSIQPAAQALPGAAAETAARLFRVLIEVEKPTLPLKAGMTGYAKIHAGYRPLGFLLARPLIRFVLIEMWSWLP